MIYNITIYIYKVTSSDAPGLTRRSGRWVKISAQLVGCGPSLSRKKEKGLKRGFSSVPHSEDRP